MSSGDPEIPFAFWLDPVSALTVRYSLPLFHEIDFQVNEGYRRIPHGGVEVGGVLYGKVAADSITIEAFRPIDCEHASGPSFHLSERDLTNLSESISAASNDSELQGLLPLGWFIAHTRSALQMSERELELFQRFFSEPRRVTVLVKPERFKATRFAFILRDGASNVNPNGEQHAVILPLPGRSSKTGTVPAPAIPAPNPSLIKQPIEPLPSSAAIIPSVPLTIPSGEIPSRSELPPLAIEALAPSISVPVTPATGDILMPEPMPVPVPEPAAETGKQTSAALPSTAQPIRSGLLLLVLGVAALLGCAGGYWAYLQLPPPVISLRVQKQSNDLVVFWDPAQTQSSRYAVIRVNDSFPVLLTEKQKASGIAEVPLSGNSMKVEILTEHWVRQSRGIVRFVPAHPPISRLVPPR